MPSAPSLFVCGDISEKRKKCRFIKETEFVRKNLKHITLSFFRLGVHNRWQQSPTEQAIDAISAIYRGDYNPQSYTHDIAMVKLAQSAVLNDAVNLAHLPGSSGSVAVGTNCIVTGMRVKRVTQLDYNGNHYYQGVHILVRYVITRVKKKPRKSAKMKSHLRNPIFITLFSRGFL